MDPLLLAAQLLLAAVFALAGVSKLLDVNGSRRSMVEFGLPRRAASVAGLVLPLAELAVATGLVLQATARWAALGAFILLAAFIGGIANAMLRGRAPDCNCFGQVHSAPAGRLTLARNAVLAALAAFVVVGGPAPAVDAWVPVAIGVAATAIAVTAWELRRRSSKRARQAALAEALAAPDPEHEGVPQGSIAPAFALTDVRGGTQTLESLRRRGRPVMLQFTDLSCAPCREFLPTVARWQTSLGERVTIALVVSGNLGDRAEWDGYGIANVLLDTSGEVIDAFRVLGTPSSVGVWPDGTIAAAPAGGMHMPEVLMRILLRGPVAREDGSNVPREAAAPAPSQSPSPSGAPVTVRYAPGRS
jgi:thiol-disulfide isomerase/thioredoxin